MWLGQKYLLENFEGKDISLTHSMLSSHRVIKSHSTLLLQEERSKVDDLRGTPMAVGTLEEIIDDNHAIVSTSVGSEYYVNMLSFVDKDLIEPGCTVLLNNKVSVHYLASITINYISEMIIVIIGSFTQNLMSNNKNVLTLDLWYLHGIF